MSESLHTRDEGIEPRSGVQTTDFTPTEPGQNTGRTRIRCPHCHNPILLTDGRPDEVLCPACGGSFRVQEAPETTTTGTMRPLGKFQLMERVGVGAFGAVWRARDTELDRIVALKIPHASLLTSETDLERFRREAKAAAQLRHSGIVSVHEVQTLEGLPTIVSDFIEGVPLRDLLEVRRLTFREGATLVADVAEALDYAHSMGLVHRDIKPANIMMESVVRRPSSVAENQRPSATDYELRTTDSALRPLVMDFGVVLRQEAEIILTLDGHIVGTPAYMSPEQAAGKSHQADRRSDVYSLGVILYELLCGELPFRGSKMMILHQVLHEEPRPLRQLNDKIPRDLETICLKAMAKAPARRYATARALAEDLRRFLKGEPIHARPVGRVERFWRWCGRNPMVALLTAAAAAFLLAGTGISSYFAIEADRRARDALSQKERADDNATEARTNAKRAEDTAAEARANLYAAHMNLAQREWEDGHVGRVMELLEAERPRQPGEKDLRGWEWYYQERLCHDDLRTLKGHPVRGLAGRPDVSRLAVSPDGSRLALVGNDGTVWLWDSASGQELRIFKGHKGGANSVAFSPDWSRLAAAGGDGIVRLWDCASGQELRILKGHIGWVYTVAFSPDGTQLASAGGDGTVRLWDCASGQELRTLKVHTDQVNRMTFMAFSPDLARLVSFSFDRTSLGETIRLWDAATGKEVRTLKGHKGSITCLAFSPDGSRLASAGRDGTVRLWDSANGQELRILKGHTAEIQGVAFSPDGSRLASAGGDGTVRLWDSASGQELRILKGHIGSVYTVAFSPDGTRLASAGGDGTVRLWDSVNGQELRILKGHTKGVYSVVFSPDGARLASASYDGTVRLWDRASSCREARTLFGSFGSTSGSLAFSPDGKRLVSAGGPEQWDAVSGVQLARLGRTKVVDGVTERFWENNATGIAISPDGAWLAWGDTDGTIRLYDSATGRELRALKGHTSGKHPNPLGWKRIPSVAISPDGAWLASAGEDGTVRLWDSASGRELRTLKGDTDEVFSVAISPDGSWLASAGGQEVKLWDAGSGQELRTLSGHRARVTSVAFSPRVTSVAFSPNGMQLASAVAFSPNGTQLASAGGDGTVRLWDSASGQELRVLKGHTGWVSGVAFSPDGARLASAGGDGTVRLWDSASGQELRILKGYTGGVVAVAFSPDGAQLAASGGGDGTVRLWDARPWTPELRVEREATRLVEFLFAKPLTKAEVIDNLRANKTVTEAVREKALFLVNHHWQADPFLLSQAGWAVVCKPGADAAAYRQALLQAEEACRLVPDNCLPLITLGVAQYRLGRYQQAAESLSRSNKLRTPLGVAGPIPVDLAFLAMAHHQLGQKEQAQDYLKRLREAMKTPRWASDEQAQAVLREAEALLQGTAAAPAK